MTDQLEKPSDTLANLFTSPDFRQKLESHGQSPPDALVQLLRVAAKEYPEYAAACLDLAVKIEFPAQKPFNIITT